MDKSNKLLSEIVAFRTYAKYLPVQGRRESLSESINRNLNMHLNEHPKLSRDIIKAYQKVHEYKVFPSMRALQFSGDAILKNNIRGYNCSALHIDAVEAFAEVLFLLLSGCGVGFSCQKRHINKLPPVQAPREEGTFVIHDSINGWAQAVGILMDAYFYGRMKPIFDYSNIRDKGSYLVTTGAKAPGPDPLRMLLSLIESRLKVAEGRRLRSMEVHDIVCIIADGVLAGGIRRAALISLFDATDEDMLSSKAGSWWEKHPYRARANNTAMLNRYTVTKEQFRYVYDKCIASNSGEPGFMLTGDMDLLTNPCGEIGLRSGQFCNLVSINQTAITSKKDWLGAVYSATLLGTIQASYTDFPFLRPQWKDTTELEALLGISCTGIADRHGVVTAEWLQEGAALAKEVNEKYAAKIGINSAYRLTTVKPEGSCSAVAGSSSGIHARHSDYYLRRVRMNADDSLAVYLSKVVPELVEDDKFSNSSKIIIVPQKSPEGAITRDMESARSLFERTLFYHRNWVKPGHVQGINTHNVSVTISYEPHEVEELFEMMWEYREEYTAISLLPKSDHTYIQAPFEECDKQTFDKYNEIVQDIDLSQVREDGDNTNRGEIVACGGGVCELV